MPSTCADLAGIYIALHASLQSQKYRWADVREMCRRFLQKASSYLAWSESGLDMGTRVLECVRFSSFGGESLFGEMLVRKSCYCFPVFLFVFFFVCSFSFGGLLGDSDISLITLKRAGADSEWFLKDKWVLHKRVAFALLFHQHCLVGKRTNFTCFCLRWFFYFGPYSGPFFRVLKQIQVNFNQLPTLKF